MATTISHPAKYPDILLPIFAQKLQGYYSVLDPMAGTGKIAQIYKFGWRGSLYCNDIEREWKTEWKTEHGCYGCYWTFSDAAKLEYKDGDMDAICTSPTYGNRLADHWERHESSKRFSYTFNLGHDLNPENTGKMHWGKTYQEKHIAIWKECLRVLRHGGRLILNISNHIRKKQEIDVTGWHEKVLIDLGLKLMERIPVQTHRLRNGANFSARVGCEWILVFEK